MSELVLEPKMLHRVEWFVQTCAVEGIKIQVYQTYRPHEQQAILYRRGRRLTHILEKAIELRERWGRRDLHDILIEAGPQFGRLCTYAAPGQSMHGYKLAADFVPVIAGKLLWDTRHEESKKIWSKVGEIAVACELSWGGNWSKFKDYVHLQWPGTSWKTLIRN